MIDDKPPTPLPIAATQCVLNPFGDPPPTCTESDVRWFWRKSLEEKRGHAKNKQYYSNYVGSKKSRQFLSNPQISNLGYCGNHHLKHLVKIGCPKHDLLPILKEIGYNVDNAICSHKSHLCAHTGSNDPRYFMGSVSMKDVGLIFKRNAFSTSPLKIEYSESSNPSIAPIFSTEVYIKRIANTNFSKAFRPGSYGKLQSLKKGSWKEGKIFYVFDNDELVLRINENLWIGFDLKSSASDSNDEANTIDGWKSIVGGVGLWCPPDATSIASVLVLRKSVNFPLDCLQNSTIKIYSRMQHPDGAMLYIGNKAFGLNNQSTSTVSSAEQVSVQHSNQGMVQHSNQIQVPMNNMVTTHGQNMQMEQHYNNLLSSYNQLSAENMRLIQSNNNLVQEKQDLTTKIYELQGYVETQNQQIARLVGISSTLLGKVIDFPSSPSP